MPLSPEEQKILQEIEKSFYEHDPQFSRKVSESTIYRVAGRNLKWLALGFVAAFAFTIWSFTQSLALGVLGFLVMLGVRLLLRAQPAQARPGRVAEPDQQRCGRAGWVGRSVAPASGCATGSSARADLLQRFEPQLAATRPRRRRPGPRCAPAIAASSTGRGSHRRPSSDHHRPRRARAAAISPLGRLGGGDVLGGWARAGCRPPAPPARPAAAPRRRSRQRVRPGGDTRRELARCLPWVRGAARRRPAPRRPATTRG